MPRARLIPGKPDRRFIAESERIAIINLWNSGLSSGAIGAALWRSPLGILDRVNRWRKQGTFLRSGHTGTRRRRGRLEPRQPKHAVACSVCSATIYTWSFKRLYCSLRCKKRAAKHRRDNQ
jgi:hypothetical protein